MSLFLERCSSWLDNKIINININNLINHMTKTRLFTDIKMNVNFAKK